MVLNEFEGEIAADVDGQVSGLIGDMLGGAEDRMPHGAVDDYIHAGRGGIQLLVFEREGAAPSGNGAGFDTGGRSSLSRPGVGALMTLSPRQEV